MLLWMLLLLLLLLRLGSDLMDINLAIVPIAEVSKPAEVVKVVEEKKVGRPVGSKNKAAKFKHYKPKKWQEWMTALVLASKIGKSNKELAELFEITPEHVSNILSTDEAEAVTLTLRKSLLEQSTDMASEFTKLAEMSLKRIKDVMANDTLAINNPFPMLRASLEVMKLTFPKEESGVSSPQGNINIQQNNNILVANPEYLERITKGLETANEIAVIHNDTRQKLLKVENG